MTTRAAAVSAERQLNPSTVLVGILAAGFIVRMLFVGADGYRTDVSSFMSWAMTVAQNPLSDFYAKAGFADYPPGYLLVLWIVGKLYLLKLSVFGPHPPATDYGTLRFLIKLPAILFDLANAWLIYLIVRRYASQAWANGAAALYVLNPASIYVSAYWGQVDSVSAGFVLAALTLLVYSMTRSESQARWFVIGAWLAIAYAVLIKPPAVMLAVLMIAWAFATSDAAVRMRRSIDTALGLVAGLILAFVVAYMFHPDVTTAMRWLIERYQFGSAVYPYTTVNAFNLHSVFRPFWQSDTVNIMLGGLSLGPMWLWGIVLVAAAAVLIVARYLQRKDDIAFLEAAMLLSLGFFVLATRMHERYVFNAFVLMIPLAALNRRYLLATVGITLTLLANLWYALYYASAMEQHWPVNGIDIFPLLTHPLSLLNVAIFFWLGYIYLGGKVPEPSTEAAGVAVPGPAFGERAAAWVGRVWFTPTQGLFAMTRADWVVAGGFTLIGFILDYMWYWLPPDRYFDEIYYPRSGVEYLKAVRINTDWEFPFEWTHPPLTKLLIAGSIAMFGGVAHGDNGWGWRFLNVICGTLFIPLIYLFAKRLMGSTLFASIAAFMLTLDGFRFVQSRIATPEIWVATLTLGVLYAFYRFWTAAQVRLRLNVPAEFGLYFWLALGGGTVIAAGFSRLVNSFGATPPNFNSYAVAFVYAELGFYLLARWAGRKFAPPGPVVASYAEGSRVILEGRTSKIVRWDGGAAGKLALEDLELDYRRDGTLVYATPEGKATFTAAGEMQTEVATVEARDSATWFVVLCLAGAALASSKWNGLFDLFVIWLAVAVVVLQRFLPRPAAIGNPWGFTPDQLIGTMVFTGATLYALCYIPNYLLGYNLADVVGMQQQMYWYHSQLSKSNPASLNHPYGSYWWQWPFLFAPISYFWNDSRVGAAAANGAACCVAEILALPNPLVWWFGLFSVPAIAWWGFKERNKGYLLLATAYLFHWLPWILTPRIAFEYHFFPNLAIIVLANAVVLQRWWRKLDNRVWIGAYLAGVLAAFIFFYPITAATPLTYDAWHSRMWLDNWLDLIPGKPHPHGLSWIKPN